MQKQFDSPAWWLHKYRQCVATRDMPSPLFTLSGIVAQSQTHMSLNKKNVTVSSNEDKSMVARNPLEEGLLQQMLTTDLTCAHL